MLTDASFRNLAEAIHFLYALEFLALRFEYFSTLKFLFIYYFRNNLNFTENIYELLTENITDRRELVFLSLSLS